MNDASAIWHDGPELDSGSMELDATEQVPRAALEPPKPGSPGRQLLRQRMFPAETAITRIGRYVVLRFIGSGGMGQVFAAYDSVLDRKVAIKLLGAGSGARLEHRTRMLREAQAMAKLSHPNVIQVYEVGEHDQQIYICMEFVEGRTLAAWLAGEDGRRPSARMILDKFVEVGRGLAAAHRAGLVHRDFKPSNVIVDAQGCARVLDFGLVAGSLAQREGEDEPLPGPSEALRALDVELTTTGTMLGTPAYMAPEQFDGGLVDARTDQFGFCVSLFEALTGARPFAGDSIAELSRNVVQGRRGPTRLRGVPRRVIKAIERGLARSPAQRWPAMDELLEAIAPASRRRIWGFASAALLPIVGVIGWRMVDDYERELDAKTHQIATEQRARVELESEAVRGHDRRLLNTAASVHDNPQRAIELLREVDLELQLDRSQWVATATERVEQVMVPTQVVSPRGLRSGIRSVQISPDARLLALASFREARLWRLGDASGPPAEIDLGEGVIAAALDPSRPGRVALGGDGFLRVIDVETDEIEIELGAADAKLGELAFSPDGRWIAGYSGLGPMAQVRLWSTDGKTTAVLLAPLHGKATEFAFSPDGTRIAALFDTDGTIAVWRLDGPIDRPTLLGAPRGEFATALSFSPDGNTLAVGYDALGNAAAPIRLWHLDAERLDANTLLTGHRDRIATLAFAPDGRRLVSGSFDRTARIWELDSGRSHVLHGFEDVVAVGFSADGEEVLSWGSGTVRLWPVDRSRPPIAMPGARVVSHGSLLAVTAGKRVLVYDRAAAPERPGLARALDTGPTYNSEFGSRAAIDPTGRWLAALPRRNVIYLWDTRDWTLAAIFRHDAWGDDLRLAVAPDGRVIAASESGDVLAWRPGAESPLELGSLGVEAFGCELGERGETVLVHGADGVAKLFETSEPGEGRALARHPALVRAAAFGPGERSLATGSGTTVYLWRELDDERPVALEGHTGEITSLSFAPDGASLLSAAKDGSARLWSVADGRELAEFGGHEGIVNTARFSPDGRTIVTAASDGTARVWSLDGGDPIVLSHEHHPVIDAVFAPDGATLLTGTANSTGHRWTLDGPTGPSSVELSGNGANKGLKTGARPLEAVAFVNAGADALVITEDSVWIWDADYSDDALLTWMWRSFPSCPSSDWREANLGLDRAAAEAAEQRCDAMVECVENHDYGACRWHLAEPSESE